MVQFICFGSGSSGNCYYFSHNGYAFLIDLGIGIRTFKREMRNYGLPFSSIRHILVSHDHTDHIKAVGALSQEFHLPVYTSALVHQGMERNFMMTKKVPKEQQHVVEHRQTFTLGDFHITPFEVPHDSSQNNGYYITCGDWSLCFITDAGHVTDDMREYISKATHLIVEANYDAELLRTGPYPAYLQKRISGERGHMCNDEMATTLAQCLNPKTKHIWLCHLSEENNLPDVAHRTVEDALKKAGYDLARQIILEPLRRKVPSPLYELE